MSEFFIDQVGIYDSYKNTEKGKLIQNFAKGLERFMISDTQAFSSTVNAVKKAVKIANEAYPEDEWEVRVRGSWIEVNPVEAWSLPAHKWTVASIHLSRCLEYADRDVLDTIVNDFKAKALKKGGESCPEK